MPRLSVPARSSSTKCRTCTAAPGRSCGRNTSSRAWKSRRKKTSSISASNRSDVLEPKFRELLAELVDIHAQFAGGEALALFLLHRHALGGGLGHFRGFGAAHHAHAIVV